MDLKRKNVENKPKLMNGGDETKRCRPNLRISHLKLKSKKKMSLTKRGKFLHWYDNWFALVIVF